MKVGVVLGDKRLRVDNVRENEENVEGTQHYHVGGPRCRAGKLEKSESAKVRGQEQIRGRKGGHRPKLSKWLFWGLTRKGKLWKSSVKNIRTPGFLCDHKLEQASKFLLF